jgi:hypothetical protein
MSILFHADLVDRDFGTHLLSVNRLTAWAQTKDLELVTMPPIDGFKFVQVEALLCAIERAVSTNTTLAEAAAIVQSTPFLAQDRAAKTAPRWLVGADAHQQWRHLIEQAVNDGELSLLNYGSKLPIKQAPAVIETTPTQWYLLATPSDLIKVFGTITRMDKAWFNNAKDTPGLKAALHTAGVGGHKGREPLYRIFEVMQWLINPKRRKGESMEVATGWRLLKNQFPSVYEEYQSFEPESD